ncbi:MAG TPA: hypothetical protein DDY14_03620 [Chromatiaceae bacterium]|nr:MAG: hypothetical protein N838_07835 [Thiohalocapsa sp. PB-PSB1]HBG94416.1 hypothetical protein [Chromatiaceae bacterium]
MINRGWGEPVATSHLFRSGVADLIHLSGKTVMSATSRDLPRDASRGTSAEGQQADPHGQGGVRQQTANSGH